MSRPRLDVLLARIEALDRLTDAKFVTFRTLIDSQAEKVKLALDAAKEAILKAETATDKRFDGVNEFRQTLSDQAQNFVNRDQHDAMREMLAAVQARLDKLEGRSSGLTSGWGYLIGAAGLIIAIAAFVTR